MIFRVLRLKEIKCANVLYLNPGEGIREVVNRIPDKQMNPEKRLIRQEAKQLLEKAIDDLPEKIQDHIYSKGNRRSRQRTGSRDPGPL